MATECPVSSAAFDRIIARAHNRVIDRYRVTGTEVSSFDELVGEVLAEIRRKAAKHQRAADEMNILLRRAYVRRAATAYTELSDFDLAMLTADVPVPPEVTNDLGVGPEPWHPEYPRIESD